MAKLKKTNLLAILFVLVGLSRELRAAGAKEWGEASESWTGTVNTSTKIANGKILLDGILLSSAPALNAFVLLRDSGTAVTSAGAFLAVFFSSTTSGSTASSGVQYKFVPPLRMFNGLQVEPTSCASGTVFCYQVLYRRVSD